MFRIRTLIFLKCLVIVNTLRTKQKTTRLRSAESRGTKQAQTHKRMYDVRSLVNIFCQSALKRKYKMRENMGRFLILESGKVVPLKFGRIPH
jgi:hypothetical protein